MKHTLIDNRDTGLKIENISVQLGNKIILRNLFLEVSKEEMMVLVGASGSGKTTLLHAIAGLVSLKQGKISINGCDVTNFPPAKRNIGMVFQEYALYNHRSVLGNLEFPLRMRGINKKERKIMAYEIAKRLDIHELVNRSPIELSGGERQRVALGRALVRSPNIFLLDEPLSNVDASLVEELRGLILEIHRKSKVSAIYVTHNRTEAWRIADKIGVMSNGSLLQVGSPSELYDFPKNRFVAELISDIYMSIIPLEMIPNEYKNKLLFHYPESFELGIRQEDITAITSYDSRIRNDNDYFYFPTIVHHVERIGGKHIIVSQDKKVIIRAPLKDDIILSMGDKVVLKISYRDIYLFSHSGNLVKPKGKDLQ